MIGKAIAKPVRFQPVSPENYYESALQSGCSPAFAQSLVNMHAEIAEGIYDAEPRTPETTTPTTLRQWAETSISPILTKQ